MKRTLLTIFTLLLTFGTISIGYGQTNILVAFPDGVLGDQESTGGNGCENCVLTSVLGITNVQFGQLSTTGQFIAQGNDVPGFVRFIDNNGDEYELEGNIQWRQNSPGNILDVFGFVFADGLTPTTIQTTQGSFTIRGLNDPIGPTSTMGFILPGRSVDIESNGDVNGNAASDAIDVLNELQDEQLFITVGPCWRTLSIPNSGQSYQDFFASFRINSTDYGGLWTQGATGARFSGGDPNVYTMDGTGVNWTPITDLTTTPAAGTGILISIFDEDEFGNAASGGFPKVAELSGTENAAPVSVSLGTPNGTTTSADGFSLLGNPFYSGVDFDLLTKSGITGNVWIYDRNAGGTDANGNNGGWISWNGTTGDITDGIIADGQGFVVQNTNPTSSPSVTFEEADKTTGGFFYGKENEQTLPDHLRMEVRGEGVYNSAWVQFSDEGVYSDIMRDDVVQFYPFESEYAVLSTMKSGDLLDIGHFPYPDENLQIPLTVETTTSGQLTITLTDLQYRNGNVLYLHDTVTGKTIEIEEGMEYTFSSSASKAKSVNDCFSSPTGFAKPMKGKMEGPRFYISSSVQEQTDTLPSEFVLQQNYPNPFNPTTEISYELPTQSDVRLEVFDLTGRQVATLVNENISAGTHTVNFNAANLSSGVYMYRLQAGSNVLTRKLTLIK